MDSRSSNLDPRRLQLNFELDMEVIDATISRRRNTIGARMGNLAGKSATLRARDFTKRCATHRLAAALSIERAKVPGTGPIVTNDLKS